MAEVWILGGTGRSGRAIADGLRQHGIRPVLVGRDADRLRAAADGDRTVVAASVGEMAAEIRRQRPAVVVNTVGPFTGATAALIRACLPGGHYVDIANDLGALESTLALDPEAAAAGRTVVTGSGFGVTATESVIVKLCEDRPPAARVRVDMVPSLSIEAGRFGEALAATIMDGFAAPGLRKGREFRGGRVVPAPLAGHARRLTLPDGVTVTTASMPLGELLAAQRASGASDVIAASSEAPSSAAVRAVLPLASALLGIGAVRAFVTRRLAAVTFGARPRPREHSWGHAVVTWADGTTREGWLRLGDAQPWVGTVTAEVARRLLAGEGRPGAYTPATLFGSSLAEDCGAEYVLP
ncbi:saccharopine dehydrogenase NADP-binding domain-containing protein [Catenuloplanes japonicus]|uniref:saccharopine dehydrogenase NADP-binding domain-containing protein n=1 Tax=Catenuloplanes japonicus TaxID=33876 RepID=UPI0005250087|nr:saccharopine dehydrogenase NADP-binding domain-containing protein [Catenuloplanes japonicus]